MRDDAGRRQPAVSSAFDVDGLAAAVTDLPAHPPFPTASDRSAWAAVDPASAERIRAAADAGLAAPWPVLTLGQRLAYGERGDRRVFEEPFFMRRRRLVALALALAVTDDDRYAAAVVDGIGLILEELSWCVPAHDAPPGEERRALPDPERPVLDLFAAETGATLAWIAWLHADRLALVPGLPERVRHAIHTRVLAPFDTAARRSFWFGGETNWNPWIVSNVLTCASLTPTDRPTTRQILATALESLDGYVAQIPQDGACAEGIMYWWQSAVRLYEAVDVLRWADPSGAATVLAHPVVRRTARYPLTVWLGGEWSASFADGVARVPAPGPGVDKERHPAALWHRFASAVGDTRSAAAAGSLPRALELPTSMYRCFVTLFDPGWRSAPATPVAPEGDHWLAQAHVTSTATTDGRLRLVAKGGHNDEPHNHADVGSFVVAVDGVPVVIDVGTGQYTARHFSPDRYSIWYTQSAFHGVPEVDGVGQGVGREFAATVLHRDAQRFSLDLARAYRPEAGIESWLRDLTVDDGGLTVHETWHLGRDGAEIRLHVMLADVPVPDGDGVWLLPGPDGGPPLARLEVEGLEAAGIGAAPVEVRSDVETIDLDDAILRGVWGERIARLVLTIPATPAHGSVRLLLRPLILGAGELAPPTRE